MTKTNFGIKNISQLKRAILDVMSVYHETGKSLRSVLREYRRNTNLDEKGLATLYLITIGSVRFQNTIDFILSRNTKRMKFKSLPLRIKILLRVSLYWIRWYDESFDSVVRILYGEDNQLRNVLHRSVNFDLFKAVQNLPRSEFLSIELSFPTFIVETLLENMDEKEAINLMLDGDRETYSYLRINQLLSQDPLLLSELEMKGVELVEDSEISSIFRINSGIQKIIQSPTFLERKILIHDKASVITARTLAAGPGDSVWDACAAPGMKTQALWEMMESQGDLIATERNENRFKEAIKQSSIMGMTGVDWRLGDAAKCPVQGADKILIDAPCTSTGMIHSHPSFKWRLNKETLFSTMTIQNKILEGILSGYSDSPGTVIVYSTCSILPHEGESQIDSVLEKYPVELMDIPLVETVGYPKFKCSKNVRRMFPHTHGTDGFFIAKMRIKH
ncbi:MAG: RsmB/NOP family class I SAM-dependent RNA methyltransferase [Candidatus Thorarchaeota archaeon]|jgi:16S rRNA (cytosine967-C5)-methyltransferase